MSASSQRQVELSVVAEDEATEIWVYDGQYQLKANAPGRLSVRLDPGFYKVRATAGNQVWENLVALSGAQTYLPIQVPPLVFASPVPLPRTAQTHEYHEGAARAESQKTHVVAGQGSAIFVFARRFTPPGPPQAAPGTPSNPAAGLKLWNLKGDLVADLEAQSAYDDCSWGGDPWAACNVTVDPGSYCLSLDNAPDTSLQQVIVASPGWQTQVFMLQGKPDSRGWGGLADLAGASILLSRWPSRNPGFDPLDPIFVEGARLSELARLGLANRHQVLDREVTAMLWQKFDNPMLGIYGAHLLLLGLEPDLELLRMVVTNLRSLLGGSHPDVEALALRWEPSSLYVFDTPPMLRRSWSLILEASARRKELVPLASLASQIAPQVWGDGPWLQWTGARQDGGVGRELVSFRRGAGKRQSARTLTDTEAALAAHLEVMSAGGGPESAGQKPQLDDEAAQKLVQALGVPRAEVEDLVDRLWQKASKYESVRHKMPFSQQRTMELQKIVAEGRRIAAEAGEELPSHMQSLIQEDSEGSRVMALAALEQVPDPQFFSFVEGAISHWRSPFEQYHALLAALGMLPSMGGSQRQKLQAVVKAQRGRGLGKGIRPTTDRWPLSDMILQRLASLERQSS